VSVFGEASRTGTAETLARVGYVAQDHPLYRDFSVADMFHLGRAMNPRWDQELAAARGIGGKWTQSWPLPASRRTEHSLG
jgi:ABC-2 type transport system ATP-binding protein